MRGYCTICETPFSASLKDISAIGCGHVFHHACLVNWSALNKPCPHCKTKPTGEITRLHFCCIPSETIKGDPRMLKAKIDKLERWIEEAQKKNANIEEKAKMQRDELLEELATAKQVLDEQRHTSLQAEEQNMRAQEKLCAQIDFLQKKNADIEETAKKERDGLLEELAITKQTVTEYQKRFDGQEKCLDEFRKGIVLNKTTTTAKNPAVDADIQKLKTCCTILKTELLKSRELIKIKFDQTEEQLKEINLRQARHGQEEFRRIFVSG